MVITCSQEVFILKFLKLILDVERVLNFNIKCFIYYQAMTKIAKISIKYLNFN